MMFNFSDRYRQNISETDGNVQLLIGLKKHLLIAQSSSEKKENRHISLNNITEALEFIACDINDSIPKEERSILEQFFKILLVKTKNATIDARAEPETFIHELEFIDALLNSMHKTPG